MKTENTKPEKLKNKQPMSKKKKWIIAAIAVAAALAVAGLSVGLWAILRNKDIPPDNGGDNQNVVEVKPGVHGLSEITNGIVTTRYKIVIPSNADNKTNFAAMELAALLNHAIGARPEIIADANPASAGEYFLSVGKTKQMLEQNFNSDYSRLRERGYSVHTVDKAAYMFGATGNGNVNAVYGFCEHSFGYEFFATDEYSIRREVGVKLPIMNVVMRPDFDLFAPMYGELNTDPNLISRLRVNQYYDIWLGGMDAHSYFRILPPSVYEADHENWYSEERNPNNPELPANLCLTRSPELKAEFIKRVKEEIEADPSRNYFMMGQEDNFGFCDCPTCEAQMIADGKKTEDGDKIKAGAGGKVSSGIVMRFTNDVVREVKKWLAEEHPERDMTFVMFAYNHTKTPPVKFNASTGGYDPIDPDVAAEQDLSVMFVISFVDYFKPYTEDATVMRMLNGWNTITNNLTIWEYCTNFDNYMEPFANWGSMAPNYRLLKEKGATYIVEQGSYGSATSSFSEMRMYIQSKLSWDVTLNTAELIDKFLRAYYKEAYPAMREYFDFVLNHTAATISEKGLIVRSGSSEIMNQTNWSYMTLTRMENLINEAFKSIEPLKAANPALYQTLWQRVLKQSITPRFFRLTMYPPADQVLQYEILKNDALSVGITGTSEGAGW